MPELKSTGYFRELPMGDPAGPSLQESRSGTPNANEDEIVAYLDTSPIMLWSPELIHDVLEPGTVIGSMTIHTDGVWEWPADLAYYVKRYHVALDPAFVEHMASRGWMPPAPHEIDVDVEQVLGVVVDGGV